jgi:hypothetical protein
MQARLLKSRSPIVLVGLNTDLPCFTALSKVTPRHLLITILKLSSTSNMIFSVCSEEWDMKEKKQRHRSTIIRSLFTYLKINVNWSTCPTSGVVCNNRQVLISLHLNNESILNNSGHILFQTELLIESQFLPSAYTCWHTLCTQETMWILEISWSSIYFVTFLQSEKPQTKGSLFYYCMEIISIHNSTRTLR